MTKRQHFENGNLQHTKTARGRTLRRQMALGIVLVLAGVSYVQARSADMVVVQLAPSTDNPGGGQTSGSSPPAESKPGGTRPTTPAPEPARPDPEAQREGAPTALPPAPAEKTAPPIDPK